MSRRRGRIVWRTLRAVAICLRELRRVYAQIASRMFKIRLSNSRPPRSGRPGGGVRVAVVRPRYSPFIPKSRWQFPAASFLSARGSGKSHRQLVECRPRIRPRRLDVRKVGGPGEAVLKARGAVHRQANASVERADELAQEILGRFLLQSKSIRSNGCRVVSYCSSTKSGIQPVPHSLNRKFNRG